MTKYRPIVNEKFKQRVYDAVHEAIMEYRVKCLRGEIPLGFKTKDGIDNVLYQMQRDAARAAVKAVCRPGETDYVDGEE